MKTISRKAPCPCGSGKKFGDCCGTHERYVVDGKGASNFAVARSVAYKGEVGKKREEFCVNYTRTKSRKLREIRSAQDEEIRRRGYTLTCQKGCKVCCSFHIEASIQECEAIVYHLYHDDPALASFLQAYPEWRRRLKQNGDLYKELGTYWSAERTPDNAERMMREFAEVEQRYFAQEIPCPFLSSGQCLIYEVRPYVCASYSAVTPAEWCAFGSVNRPYVLKSLPSDVLADHSFYHGKELGRHIRTTMPVAVYEILKSGVIYYSMGGIPGLEDIDSRAFANPEVRQILRGYGCGPGEK